METLICHFFIQVCHLIIQKKQRREHCEPDPEEKKKYQEEANQFAMSLVEGLGDPDGNNIK